MSIEVMAKVWKHSPYGEGTLLVLLAMADWANDDGFCWPSIPQLAHKSRQSERNVRYNLRRLEEDKVIDRVEHRGKGHRNEYQINLQNLQGLPDFDTKSGKNTSSSITYKRKPAKPANLQNLQVATSKPASSARGTVIRTVNTTVSCKNRSRSRQVKKQRQPPRRTTPHT
jgi:hypothetical protein